MTSRFIKAFVTVLLATSAVLSGAAAPAQAAPVGVLGIWNAGSVGSIGVYHYYSDSSYVLLPQGVSSEFRWGRTGGVWIGSGYCFQRWTSPDGRTYKSAGSDVKGPIKFRTDGDYFVKIVPYRQRSANAC